MFSLLSIFSRLVFCCFGLFQIASTEDLIESGLGARSLRRSCNVLRKTYAAALSVITAGPLTRLSRQYGLAARPAIRLNLNLKPLGGACLSLPADPAHRF